MRMASVALGSTPRPGDVLFLNHYLRRHVFINSAQALELSFMPVSWLDCMAAFVLLAPTFLFSYSGARIMGP
jgi:hypothetical protein